MDESVEKFILEKTEGVPFFIEEFIKSIRDLKIIEKEDSKYHMGRDIQDVNIPSTIQDVIMARVDSLSEGAKDVLQAGSVIEREFSWELIKKVTGFSEQALISDLFALKDSELIYERGIFPQSIIIFKHALTRDVVYDSLLSKKRKKLHGKIGDAIEELYKDNIKAYYELLAEHYIANENYEKAVAYSNLAGKKAAKAASLNEAITYAKKRVASIEKFPGTDEVAKERIDARTILGLYMTQMNLHTEAKEAIDPIFDLALKYDYKIRLSQIHAIAGAYYVLVKEDFLEGSKHLEKTLKISEEVNDIVSLILGHYWLGTSLSLNCEFEKTYFHLNKALEINEVVNNLWAIAAMKSTISMVYYFHGKIDFAYQTSEKTLQIGEESGDTYSKGLSYTGHGISCYGKGFFEEAVRCLLKAAEFCERMDIPFWDSLARYNLGDVYFEMGKYDESQKYYNEAASSLERDSLFSSFSNLCKVGYAKAYIMNNENDINLELVYNYHKRNNYKLLDGWMARYIGEILLNIDDQHISEAGKWIKKAIDAHIRYDISCHLCRDYALYAELFKRKGDHTKARENLNKAIEIMKECGADGWVGKYEKELASL